jgi:hypothetical protein
LPPPRDIRSRSRARARVRRLFTVAAVVCMRRAISRCGSSSKKRSSTVVR